MPSMPLLHDASVRSSLENRVRALRVGSAARWGQMSVDQMLWHVNQSMVAALGQTSLAEKRLPVPKSVVLFAVLNLPWGKGAPTNQALVATSRHDFDQERARCLTLIAEVVDRPMTGVWQQHPTFGPMTGKNVSRLQAKHLDHHLKQFGV